MPSLPRSGFRHFFLSLTTKESKQEPHLHLHRIKCLEDHSTLSSAFGSIIILNEKTMKAINDVASQC